MWRITAPSLVLLAMLTGTMGFTVAWVAEERLPPLALLPHQPFSDPAVLDGLLVGAWTCISNAQLHEGTVTRATEDDGRRWVWQTDPDGQERLWVNVSADSVDWCTSGERVSLPGSRPR